MGGGDRKSGPPQPLEKSQLAIGFLRNSGMVFLGPNAS